MIKYEKIIKIMKIIWKILGIIYGMYKKYIENLYEIN